MDGRSVSNSPLLSCISRRKSAFRRAQLAPKNKHCQTPGCVMNITLPKPPQCHRRMLTMPNHRVTTRLLRNFVQITAPVTLACAWVYSSVYAEPFKADLSYAFVVVLITQLLIRGGRIGFSRLLCRQRPQSGAWPGWGLMAPWIVLSVVFGYFAGITLVDLLMGGHPIRAIPLSGGRDAPLNIALALVPAAFASYILYARGRIASSELRAQSALRSAAEHRLKLLESQLEPHMLFNTLANLRVLIATNPHHAQGMLDQLVAFLRATLEGSRRASHPLNSEYQRIADYLALMKVRMGARLTTMLDLPDAIADIQVPPLLLQPLVENAIKHGLEPKIEGGCVEVTAQRHGDWLILRVRDTGVGIRTGTPNRGGSHFGVEQVRDRLTVLYGTAASLTLTAAADDAGGTLATVSLPFSG